MRKDDSSLDHEQCLTLRGRSRTAEAHRHATEDRLGFWAEQAERLTWGTAPTDVLDWSNAPFARWFVGGRLNVATNCVDRHVAAGNGDRIAFHWVGEPGDRRMITYRDLQFEVCRAANALVELGVRAGDRVAIYLPMIPEAVIAMLATARIGAVHTVVFGGFSADALATRISDCDAKVIITADGGYRRGAPSALKPAVDGAVERCPGVRRVVVVRRTGQSVRWNDSLDVWWHDLVGRQPDRHEAELFDSEHPLYVMYTSGTTGRPKGVLHTSGGYLVGVSYTHAITFDLAPETDVYWCTADIGWITGHSYLVYGPLANGATQVLYEGTPDTPDKGRWWDIVQEYKVSILYTAPTAIRTLMKWGEQIPAEYDLSSLRVLGTVGEPINPEAYRWFADHIGGRRCPVVDTWWQTETGAVMMAPLPGDDPAPPGSAKGPIPGIAIDVVDDHGNPAPIGTDGYLVATQPWPSMLRTVWGDDQRYIDTYWSKFPGRYFAGDGARRDEAGHIWLLGRVDDVMNVSGHRLSTTEIESALVSHPDVAEAAVVGASDPTTGQAVVAFVILRESAGGGGDELIAELRNHVAKEIGPIAKPRSITVVPDLPKTRSGKIVRRLLQDIAENRPVGDASTLADFSVIGVIASTDRSRTDR